MERPGTERKVSSWRLRHREEIRTPRLQTRHFSKWLGCSQTESRCELQRTHHSRLSARFRRRLFGQKGRSDWVGPDCPRSDFHALQTSRSWGRGHFFWHVPGLVQIQQSTREDLQERVLVCGLRNGWTGLVPRWLGWASRHLKGNAIFFTKMHFHLGSPRIEEQEVQIFKDWEKTGTVHFKVIDSRSDWNESHLYNICRNYCLDRRFLEILYDLPLGIVVQFLDIWKVRLWWNCKKPEKIAKHWTFLVT